MEGRVIFSLMIVVFSVIFLAIIIIEFLYHLLRGEVKINKEFLKWENMVKLWNEIK